MSAMSTLEGRSGKHREVQLSPLWLTWKSLHRIIAFPACPWAPLPYSTLCWENTEYWINTLCLWPSFTTGLTLLCSMRTLTTLKPQEDKINQLEEVTEQCEQKKAMLLSSRKRSTRNRSMEIAHLSIKPRPTPSIGKWEIEWGPCRVCPGVCDSPSSQTVLLNLPVREHSKMCKCGCWESKS